MAFDQDISKFTSITDTNLPFMRFIMSGGSGSRLWPLSRLNKPKQFHKLSGDETLLSATLKRLEAGVGMRGSLCVIGVQAHQQLIAEAIAEYRHCGGGHETIRTFLEPVARNTAAVAALATASALRDERDALIMLSPADHDISTVQQFWQTIMQGISAAQQGEIVTFGLLPERPETGYGYVEAAEPCEAGFVIRRFVEKPDYETALSYIRQGRFFWNSGIFLFRASVMRRAFLEHAPDIWAAVTQALENADISGTVTSLPDAFYSKAPSLSFDCAIMEKVTNRVVIPAAFRWSDLGSWQSLLALKSDAYEPDSCSNVLVGNVIAHDCHDSYLRSETGLLTVSGMSGMVVIATRDATFVAPIAQSHHVQAIVSRLTQEKRRELYYEPPPRSRKPDMVRLCASGCLKKRCLFGLRVE